MADIANVRYCSDNDLFGAAPEKLDVVDTEKCSGLLLLAEESASKKVTKGKTEVSVPKVTDDDPTADCEKLTKMVERRKCKQKNNGPSCSSSVTALKTDAEMLVLGIEGELDQYGDLLTTDWQDINKRDLLCDFKLDDLEKKYEIATQNPEKLRVLQEEAQGIQACQTEWEDYISANSSSQINSDLQDILIKTAKADLEPLKPTISDLTESITSLEAAVDKIIAIVDFHIVFCEPE